MILSLKPYQQEDVKKLLRTNCAGCFNEQRTGKTPTAINVMEARGLDKVLIVCPASMMYPWKEEWKAWTNKDAIICNGNLAKRKRLIKNWKHGPLIISYGSLKKTRTTGGSIDYILAAKPEGCIADEAHRFKDPGTMTALAMYQLCKVVPYRLALTGTPATNKPIDIYGILHWLDPKTYSSYWKFANNNFKVFDMFTGYNTHHKEIGGWLPGRQAAIAAELSEFTTQRKRKDVMPWLPEKNYLDIKLEPTRQQLCCINELEEFFETGSGAVVTQGILDRLLRIRQICIAPEVLDLPGKSPKLDWIVQYIKDYPEQPLIIFTKFKTVIDALLKRLQEHNIKNKIITGETRLKDRAEAVTQFQAGEYNILISQLDAGKEGLTLDRAETIIFIDQFPPAADIQQAEDRFVATTKDKADKAHTIIRLMLKGTYDEQLYTLVQQRAKSIDVINDYIKYIKQKGGTN